MKTLKKRRLSKKPRKAAPAAKPAPTRLTAKIWDAKQNLSKYLAHVREGGQVRIFDRSTPVADLVPIPPRPEGDDDDALLAWMEDRGMLVIKKRVPLPREIFRPGPRCPGAIQAVIDGRKERWERSE